MLQKEKMNNEGKDTAEPVIFYYSNCAVRVYSPDDYEVIPYTPEHDKERSLACPIALEVIPKDKDNPSLQ